ncbi:DNA-processing protein DprA [Tenacibaculum sp. SG-28]|uniref:DNA-processing protein DprA n=1 Tax=Tenacibaculum sp. SG-28 TaxID=754426 RepID=UPI000CF53200|nr:DNA-processing protein DprA [Tenacibaculum sp. SG-28]PQJ21819.1 DNA protecting protein DprA [Tenacibaculum sp. SG-28]
MKKEKLLAILRLQVAKHVGDITAKKLIHATGSPEQIFLENQQTLAKIPGIGKHTIASLLDPKAYEKAMLELEFLENSDYTFVYYEDVDYPTNLKQCIDAPILIFKDGNIDFTSDRIIAVVGTRNMTNYGRNFCKNLIENLAEYNPIIVSGFAYGIDICAHDAAIKNKLQNIAVLAHGLEEIYPKAHKKYMHAVQQNGGFITDFWHDEKPIREHFLKRNRIVAGLADATVVIESAEKGGSLVTADIANSYNREVFALAGRHNDAFSKGCNNLIKTNQAQLITSVNDIVEALNWDIPKKNLPVQPLLFDNLTEEEQKIVDFLVENDKQDLDTIAFSCNIPVYRMSPLLLGLEMKEIIKPFPGRLFSV